MYQITIQIEAIQFKWITFNLCITDQFEFKNLFWMSSSWNYFNCHMKNWIVFNFIYEFNHSNHKQSSHDGYNWIFYKTRQWKHGEWLVISSEPFHLRTNAEWKPWIKSFIQPIASQIHLYNSRENVYALEILVYLWYFTVVVGIVSRIYCFQRI